MEKFKKELRKQRDKETTLLGEKDKLKQVHEKNMSFQCTVRDDITKVTYIYIYKLNLTSAH